MTEKPPAEPTDLEDMAEDETLVDDETDARPDRSARFLLFGR